LTPEPDGHLTVNIQWWGTTVSVFLAKMAEGLAKIAVAGLLTLTPGSDKPTGNLSILQEPGSKLYLHAYDMQGRHVKQGHVLEAFRAASRTVTEGSVGGGTGMTALGFKAGIGTASRRIDGKLGDYTLGVLVNANFSGNLHVGGVPVGRQFRTGGVRQFSIFDCRFSIGERRPDADS
jgi:hypothetical protein